MSVRERWSLSEAPEDRGRLPRPKRLGLPSSVGETSEETPELGHGNMSVEEYLRFEEASDRKHEYVGGLVYAMAGASDAHDAITMNFISLLVPLARTKGCRAHGSDMKISIDGLRDAPETRNVAYYYPDVWVVCSRRDDGQNFKRDAVLIIEVLSKSTCNVDRTRKLDHYRSIPTLREYWIVSQDEPRIEAWTRSGDTWNVKEHEGRDTAIISVALDAELSLRDVYIEVGFGA